MSNRNRQIIFNSQYFYWITLIFTLVVMVPSARGADTRALQLSFRPMLYTDLSEADAAYRAQIDQAASEGYNMILYTLGGAAAASYTIDVPGSFAMNSWGGNSQSVVDQLATDMVSYARSKGIEPVFSFHIIGRQHAILSSSLTTQSPGLLYVIPGSNGATVINPYHTFNHNNSVLPVGQTMSVYEGIYKPVIDWIKGRYPSSAKVEYILLGNDEVWVDGMDFVAAQANVPDLSDGTTRTARAYARSINDVTSSLVSDAITPILWGDMLLSIDLKDAGAAISNWNGDSRFGFASDRVIYHADFKTISNVSVLTAMNVLQNIYDIIIVDWQYYDGINIVGNTEFPSIDYFQNRGFKEVWGASWTKSKAARSLSDYVRSKGNKGMMATTWPVSWPNAQGFSYMYDDIVQDSALLFREGQNVRTLSNFSLFNFANDPSLHVGIDQTSVLNEYEVVDPIFFKFNKIPTGTTLPQIAKLIYQSETSSFRVEVERAIGIPGGLAIMDIFEKGRADLSEITQNNTFEQSLRFGGPADSLFRTRLMLIDNDHLNLISGADWIWVETFEVNQGIRFMIQMKDDTSTQQLLLDVVLTSDLSIDAGDVVSIRYGANNIVGLSYYDANSDTLYDILDLAGHANGLPHGFDFQDDFGSGGYTGLKATSYNDGLKTMYWDRVVSRFTGL